jgi:hypothetical protein
MLQSVQMFNTCFPYFYRPSMPMAMGAVQVENHRSSFQMQVVKSTIVFIPVACDLFILYIVCYTILAGLYNESLIRQAKTRVD